MGVMEYAGWAMVIGGSVLVACGAALVVPLAWLVSQKVITMVMKEQDSRPARPVSPAQRGVVDGKESR